jgi:hypothetical protein
VAVAPSMRLASTASTASSSSLYSASVIDP